MAPVVRTPHEFESRLERYLFDRAEETRAVRVGEKEVSELAAIVTRYADLFSPEQLESLVDAEDAEPDPDERERLHRLRKTCESGLVIAQLAPLRDALTNAELSARVEFGGESLPLRVAQSRLGTISGYADREELGKRAMDLSAEFNDQRLELVRAGEELRAELSAEPDPVVRSEAEKRVSLRELASRLADASTIVSDAYQALRDHWLDRLLGLDRAERPSSYHANYVYRLSSLADVYSKSRVTDVCLATLGDLGFDLALEKNIRTDLEDRPQKAPRAAVIPSNPPTVVHLITRPLGGLQDYQSFLHEAGHALHFAGCLPALPYAFRKLSRDNALTEVYSYTIQSVIREPHWHAHYFGLSAVRAAESADAAHFLDVFVFRRNVAKLHFELDFWERFAEDGGTGEGYAEQLTAATGFTYRPDRYLADTDADFYSADYLRAAIRSAQVRAHLRDEVGNDWWRRRETGDFLRTLFREGLKPSCEEVAGRIGFDPYDVEPLVAELTGHPRETVQ